MQAMGVFQSLAWPSGERPAHGGQIDAADQARLERLADRIGAAASLKELDAEPGDPAEGRTA